MRQPDERRFWSLGVKITLWMVFVLSSVSAIVFLEMTSRERQGLVLAKQTAAMMVADLFASALVAPLDFGDADAVETEVRHLKTSRDLVYTGVWLGERGAPLFEIGKPDDGPIERPGGSASTKVFDDRVELARPVARGDGKIVGVALLRFSLARENAAYAEARTRTLMFSLLTALGTAAVLIAMTRRWIVSPLGRLVEAAKRVEAGDGRARVEVSANDEIGRLGEAFNAMSAAIVDRETRLAGARRNLQEVLDNMGQAIVVFGPGGAIIGAHSRAATELVGSNVEGANVMDLFGDRRPGDPEAQAFREWLAVAFDDGHAWETLEELAPREIKTTVEGRLERALELSFRRMSDGDATRRIMLVATDVTEKLRLVDHAASREAQHEQQMAAMRRLVAGGGHVFVAFFEAARERLSRCGVLLARDGDTLPRADIDQLFAHVHTVTGEARAFGLFDLEAETRALEAELAELQGLAGLRGSVPRAPADASLRPRLTRASDALLRGRDLFVQASPIGAAALTQITVHRGDVDALLALLADRGDEAARLVARLASRPFGESLVNLREAVPAWADKLGKRARLEIEGRDVVVPPKLARVLGPLLTHLLRNAVAHGLEPIDEREAAEKPIVGLVTARATETDHGVVIEVEDDGRGLDTAAVQERAAELGLSARDASSLVFESGLSTAAQSDLAGRGVGLAAVARDARDAGYAATITSTPGKGTRVVLRSTTSGGPRA